VVLLGSRRRSCRRWPQRGADLDRRCLTRRPGCPRAAARCDRRQPRPP